MGGDPDFDTSLGIMKALPEAGADVIELGMPFSDPMADGPAIRWQVIVLCRTDRPWRLRWKWLASFARRMTPHHRVWGYYNPIYNMGVETFLDEAVAAGIDGLIVVDLPPEMDDELCIPALAPRHQLHPSGNADNR